MHFIKWTWSSVEKALETPFRLLLITWDIIYFKHLECLCIADCWLSKMGLIGCPKMSVRNYHYPLHNNPEEHSCHLLQGRGLKSQLKTWLGCKQIPTVLRYVFSDITKNLAVWWHISKCLWCTRILGGTPVLAKELISQAHVQCDPMHFYPKRVLHMEYLIMGRLTATTAESCPTRAMTAAKP